jgi:uncharacterized protein (TIGR03905 family)
MSEDGVIGDIRIEGGCDGNLQGIARLLRGRRADEVIGLLEGIRCENNPTSCPDQLAKALKSFQGDDRLHQP